ncbi:MAG TPA: hypothetical protein VFV50_16580 [Bdellovibrionales bacterium]|nr:hypothetical protein [Bdellovibrionales bacterium]
MKPWSIRPALIVLAALFAQAAHAQKIKPFAPLTGPYTVGVTQFQWTDDRREEAFTKKNGDRRVVTVQIWYPAESGSAGGPAPYVLAPAEFAGPTDDAKKILMANALIETGAKLDVPVSKSQARFPVLIYNPGGGNPRFLSSFVALQLASHGYIVAGVEHVGDSMATHLPDGTPLTLDNPPLPPNPSFDPQTATAAQWVDQIRSEWAQRDRLMSVTYGDNLFVLKKLVELHRGHSAFKGRLDLKKIGALGWSFGGAHAAQLLVRQREIKAAVVLDGQMFGPGKTQLATEKPFLLFHGTHGGDAPGALGEALKVLNAETESWNVHLVEKSTGPRYRAWVHGTEHGSYSDWRLLFAYAGGDEREIAKARRHAQIISELTVAFFNKHLLGATSGLPTYDELEVRLQVWGR